MASLPIIAGVVTAAGVVFGAYVKVCSAIRREDRRKWSLRGNAPSQSTQSARNFVGISGSKGN
jgi:hypothetical protein